MLSRAIALWAELDEPGEQALALEALGWGCFFGGDDPSAREHFERSLELQTRGTNKRLVNRAQLAVCQIMVSQGDLEPADRLSRAALALAEEQDDAWAVHLGHHFLADCALIAADFDTAVDRYRRSLQAAVALGNRTEIAWSFRASLWPRRDAPGPSSRSVSGLSRTESSPIGASTSPA